VRKGMCERLTSAFAATPYKPQPVADAALSAGAPPKRRWWFWK